MRYIDTGFRVIPKHCIYGPRPAEGILLSDVEWWSITDHLTRDQREKELIAVQRRKAEAKKELSYDMTKTWKNTLASIKTLGNQKRQEKMEAEKQDKVDQYNEILKVREIEKLQLLEDVKKILYENRDAVKTINAAVLLSTVIEERKKQVEFKKNLEAIKALKDNEYAVKFKKEAEAFEREKIEEKIREKAKKQIQKKFLDKQMEEVERKKQLEAEEREAERQDLIKMAIEAEKVRNCEILERKYKKQFAARYAQKTQNQSKLEKLLVLEEDEEDAINQLYREYESKFKKIRKEKEEKMKSDVIKRRNKVAEAIGERLLNAEKTRTDFLDAALNEKEEEERREEERKEKIRLEAVADLLESKRKAAEDKARRDLEAKEERKWEMIQQYRRAEINEEWRRRQKLRRKELQAQAKADYDEQCVELRDRRILEKKEHQAPEINYAKEKNDISRYCDSTLEFIRKYNLPEYPVLVAIKKVKKENEIHDEKKEKEKDDGEKKQKAKPVTGFCYCFKD